MCYNQASKRIIIFGGDLNGSGTSGGLTDSILTVPVAEYASATYGLWSHPPTRTFSTTPGAIAGFKMAGLVDPGDIIARNLETFDPGGSSSSSGGCDAKPGAWSAASTALDSDSERPIADYPYMFVLPGGRLFHAGPHPPGGPAGYPYRRFYSLGTKTWSDSTSSGQEDAIGFGSAAMYRPGVILRAGTLGEGDGHTSEFRTETITIGSSGTPAWQEYAGAGKPDMIARTNHNLTILATGDVLVTGGLNPDIGHPAKRPQIWKAAEGKWTDSDTTKSAWLAVDPKTRNYHSTALLLPDGRVMTAGGEQPNDERFSVSVYEPPYLFSGDSYAARPRISNGPETMPYDGVFTWQLVEADANVAVKSVALVRPGAVTHGFDQNQRYVSLGFVQRSDPARLLVTTPVDSTIAPPGEYMLFVVDSVSSSAPRVPSIARWVKVKSGSGQLDSLDSTAPRGGTYLNLEDVSPCNENAYFSLGWNAPADDDTIGFSGLATSYNLRYKLNSSSETNFNAWTQIATSAPNYVGTAEVLDLYGFSAAVWYRFQIKAVGDNRDTSSISNALVARPRYCTEDGGDGGYSAQLVGPAHQRPRPGGTTSPSGNSIFPEVTPGVPGSDVVVLDREPALGADGLRHVRLWPGSGRGMSLDRVQLVAVDHAPGTESVSSSSGGHVAGIRSAAVEIRDHLGRTMAVPTAAGEPIYADSGEVLTVTLASASDTAQSYLLVDASGGGGVGKGIAISALADDGAATDLAVLHPRRQWATEAVPTQAGARVRLTFGGAYAIRFVGTVLSSGRTIISSAALVRASASVGGVLTDALRARDNQEAVVVARDTLRLSFADVAAGTNSERNWYLALDGTPLTAEVASFRAGIGRREPSAGLAFRLLPNVPNPFHESTQIRFDLATLSQAKLEIFDAQGRLVRRFSSRYQPGHHVLEWDLRDGAGSKVSPGIYLYRLRAGTHESQRKMVVLP